MVMSFTKKKKKKKKENFLSKKRPPFSLSREPNNCSIIHTMPYFFLITLKLLSSRVFGGQIHCHVLVLPLIELKSHIRSIDPCETDNSKATKNQNQNNTILQYNTIQFSLVQLNLTMVELHIPVWRFTFSAGILFSCYSC